MKLNNYSSSQDEILTACESFGGKAAEAAEIAEELNTQLNSALSDIDTLNDKVAELEQQIRELS